MHSVLSLPFQRHFKVALFSQASLLALILGIAALVIPLVWAYAAHSFWIKQNNFRAQPAVAFMRQLLLVLDGRDALTGASITRFHVTDPGVNQLLDAYVTSVPSVKTQEVDMNNDGIADYLNISIQMPLAQHDEIQRVRLALFLRYDIDDVARLTMQSAVLIDESSSMPSSSLFVIGDLQMVQRVLLSPVVDNYDFYKPVLQLNQTSDISWNNLVVKTSLKLVTQPSWTAPRAINQPFTVEVKVRYVEDVFQYQPGVMEVLKAAWIQYLAYFALVGTVCKFTFDWAILTGVVSSHIVVDVVPKQEGFRGYHF
ncbi:transmembrane protein [Chytriomyces sp. MP71]|nr:transmembrane protein [Chytriomyces sp. MP71]